MQRPASNLPASPRPFDFRAMEHVFALYVQERSAQTRTRIWFQTRGGAKIQKIREVGFQGSSHKTQKRRRRRSEKTDKILKSSSYICTHERPFVLNICARFYLSFCVYEKRKSACRKRRTVVIIVRGRKRVFHSRLRWINFLLRFSQSKKKGSSIVEF